MSVCVFPFIKKRKLMRSRCCLCVYVYPTIFFAFCTVRVISEGSRRLVLPRTYSNLRVGLPSGLFVTIKHKNQTSKQAACKQFHFYGHCINRFFNKALFVRWFRVNKTFPRPSFVVDRYVFIQH
jgi:hypothetical protein